MNTTTQYKTQPRLTAVASACEREGDVFISKGEVAARLGCGLRSVDEWMSRGYLPFYKLGKRVLFRWHEVTAALERNCRCAR